jgi:hypothetical protein
MWNNNSYYIVYIICTYSDPNVGVKRIEYNKKEFQILTSWPQFTNNSETYIEFKHLYEVAIGKNIRQKYCEFWNDPEGFTQN